MNTGWIVVKWKQLLFCQKEKNFVLTKCKQKIHKEGDKKIMKTTPYVLY